MRFCIVCMGDRGADNFFGGGLGGNTQRFLAGAACMGGMSAYASGFPIVVGGSEGGGGWREVIVAAPQQSPPPPPPTIPNPRPSAPKTHQTQIAPHAQAQVLRIEQ